MEQNAPQQFNQQPPTPQENPGKTLSIVSLVLGILGILASCLTLGAFFYVGIALAIAALVCGIIGRNRTPEGMPKGMATAGLILGIVGIAVGLLAIVFLAIGLAALGLADSSSEFNELMRQLEAY
jgi:hypothetical protein